VDIIDNGESMVTALPDDEEAGYYSLIGAVLYPERACVRILYAGM